MIELYRQLYTGDVDNFYEQYEETFTRQQEIQETRANLSIEEQSLLEHRAAMMMVIGQMTREHLEEIGDE